MSEEAWQTKHVFERAEMMTVALDKEKTGDYLHVI